MKPAKGKPSPPTLSVKPRGFALMTADRIRQIASEGGRAAHAKGTAHKWTPEQAREAGKLGGRGGKGVDKPRRDPEASS